MWFYDFRLIFFSFVPDLHVVVSSEEEEEVEGDEVEGEELE